MGSPTFSWVHRVPLVAKWPSKRASKYVGLGEFVGNVVVNVWIVHGYTEHFHNDGRARRPFRDIFQPRRSTSHLIPFSSVHLILNMIIDSREISRNNRSHFLTSCCLR